MFFILDNLYCVRFVWLIVIELTLFSTCAQLKFEKTVNFYTLNKGGGKYYTHTFSEKKFNLTLGFGEVSSNGPTDIFLIKTDTLGNVIKKKRLTKNYIAMAYRYSETFNPIFKLYNNNYLLSGSGYAYANVGYTARYDIYLMEMDSDVNILKMKSIAPDSEAVVINALKYAFPVSDKGIMVLCNLQYYNTTLADIYFAKIDSVYNIVWAKKVHRYPNIPTYLIKAIETKDSNYVICGGVSYTTTVGYGLIPGILYFKIDKNGNTIINREYRIVDTLYGMEAVDIIELSNGNLLIPIRIYPTSFTEKIKNGIIIIDKYGNVILSKKFYPSNDSISLAFMNILYESDNKLLGYLQSTSLSQSVNTIKDVCMILNGNGNIFLTKYYNTSYNEIYTYRKYMSNSKYNDGYFIGGNQIDVIPNGPMKLLIKKLDENMDGCTTAELQILSEPLYIMEDSGIIVKPAKSAILTWTPTVIDDGTDSTLCFCPDIPLNISKNPVNCYTNGSATITPLVPANYSYFWSPPVSSTNTASNLSAGNYTITIMDSTGCKKTFVLNIPANYSLNLSVTGQSLICSGTQNTLAIHGAQALTWNTGQTDSVIIVQPSVTTTYSAVIVNGSCQDSVYFTVNVLPAPVLTVTPLSYTLNTGDTVAVQATGATNYSWYPAFGVFSPTSGSTIITPTATADYCVIGKDSSGLCADTSCAKIYVDGTCFDIRVPNVFTPNGDGVNDEWRVRWRCPELVKEFRMDIYDRWGVKLYESVHREAGWNGRTMSGEPVPTGTYYYVIEFSMNGKKQELKGYMTLLR